MNMVFIGRSTLVRLRPLKSLSFVCLSICLKIGLLVFSDIAHDDSWPWNFVTDEARFLKKKKKIWRHEFGPNGPKLKS